LYYAAFKTALNFERHIVQQDHRSREQVVKALFDSVAVRANKVNAVLTPSEGYTEKDNSPGSTLVVGWAASYVPPTVACMHAVELRVTGCSIYLILSYR